MNVYIPTRGRPERQRTWAQLPWDWKRQTWLVVDADEMEVYARPGNSEGYQVLVYDGGPGIAQKRQWILELQAAPHVLMLDDDLDFCARHGGKLERASAGDIAICLELLARWLAEGIAHVGISARAGNNRVPDPYVEVTRQYAAMGYNLDLVANAGAAFEPACDPMEDFDMTLQLLEAGLPNRVTYDYAVGSVANAPGGCSDYRTAERMQQAATTLAGRHPGVVALTTKRGWNNLPERTDVEIAWKKAFRQRAQTTLL